MESTFRKAKIKLKAASELFPEQDLESELGPSLIPRKGGTVSYSQKRWMCTSILITNILITRVYYMGICRNSDTETGLLLFTDTEITPCYHRVITPCLQPSCHAGHPPK